MRIIPLLLALILFGTIPAWGGDAPADEFESKIRPILAEHCWKCHGPAKQSSGLRLDSREAILKGGSGEGAAIVPGDPDASPMIRAIRHDGDIVMPPKSKLSEDAVRDLSGWVKAGAPWPKDVKATASTEDLAKTHWSFQAVRKVNPPTPDGGPGKLSPIDLFLNAKLRAEGLTPGPGADRRTLIRRATYDLIGLPPTPEELHDFLADTRSDDEAFSSLVDRLLASPHYGERWGRYWLDVARYADTKGYVFTEEKKYPYSYTYRDWVVSALNEDLPYDQFIQRQIAADKLDPGPDNRNLAALGFLTVGRRFLQDQNEIIDDRIDVVTRGVLGLSVSCARCHDHKFDPIPTEDYYSLYGVFASSEEPKDLPLLKAAQGDKDAEAYLKETAERKAAVETYLNETRSKIEKDLREKFPAYLVAAVETDFNARSAKFDEIARNAKLRPESLRALATRWRARVSADDPQLAPWKALAALPAAEFRDKAGKALSEMKGSDKFKETPAAILEALAGTEPPGSLKEVAQRFGDLIAKASTDTNDAKLADIRKWLDSADSPFRFSSEESRRILNRAERDKLKAIEKKVVELDVSHPGAPPRAMVMVDKGQPVEPQVFLRGNPGRRGNTVPRRFLKVLSPADRAPFKQGSGRLDLAQAITRPDNPLTARVIVNRLWMYHFGFGLVRTPSDFGARGDKPTHADLLDWLAASFVENGWSIKKMHRAIMLTATYTRTSEPSSNAQMGDPINLWLSHQNRRRLDFEAMRDSLLAVSGRLNPGVGGKPVPLETAPFPTQRTLYGFVDRHNLEPLYRTFDFPNPDTSSPRRSATIVPQQALYLLNSPFVAEQARKLVERPEITSGTNEERVRRLYRLLFLRDPEAAEVEIGLRFLAQESAKAGEGLGSSWQYGTGQVAESDGKVGLAEFRAFPHWSGQTWQLGPKIPTEAGSYANLSAQGGHPGKDAKEATVLRWVAPAELTISVGGRLVHEPKEGDGIRARLVSDRSGLVASWEAQKKKVPTAVDRIEVRKGEILDFVVDCRSSDNSDSYSWSPVIRLQGPRPSGVRQSSWDAKADFHGPEAPGLNPWEAYAQALFITNEFFYVD